MMFVTLDGCGDSLRAAGLLVCHIMKYSQNCRLDRTLIQFARLALILQKLIVESLPVGGPDETRSTSGFEMTDLNRNNAMDLNFKNFPNCVGSGLTPHLMGLLSQALAVNYECSPRSNPIDSLSVRRGSNVNEDANFEHS